ncbi:MAG: EVE domain-containing protein [Alphaproteobacteria bacterium]
MAYWLFKSEPNTWSWDDQKKRGDKGEHWDGVRNYQANNNMKAMKIGDLGFFYHSVNEKRIMGVVKVIKEHYPDHTDEKGRFGMVDIAYVSDFTTPVTLADVKGDERFADLPLVTNSRLSVQPVDEESWKSLCAMGGLKKIPKA